MGGPEEGHALPGRSERWGGLGALPTNPGLPKKSHVCPEINLML